MNYQQAFWLLIACIGLLMTFAAKSADITPYTGDPMIETRYCGIENIKRNADGRIKRSSAVVTEYRRHHPCPSTGLFAGDCPDYNIDHTWPLSRGGCDGIQNLTWMHVKIKRCARPWCKDRYELRMYQNTRLAHP